MLYYITFATEDTTILLNFIDYIIDIYMTKGALYLVATPIGNMDDITLRAINTLKTVDYILCEKPSHSQKLLNYLGIDKPLIMYNKYNEPQKINFILRLLQDNHHIALISDAGTPLIADPGYLLTKYCVSNAIKIVALPGACSAINALVSSSLPTDKFMFIGFLDKSYAKQKTMLLNYLPLEVTLIMFEAPHRLLQTLQYWQQMMQENILSVQQKIVVAKELTKHFEYVHTASIEFFIDYFTHNPAKGEFVLLMHPVGKEYTLDDDASMDEFIKQNMVNYSTKELAKLINLKWSIKKHVAYQKILDFKNHNIL